MLSKQVPKQHYYKGYDNLFRFISYFHQIKYIQQLQPSSVLEIGIGNGTVSTYLRNHRLSITTCDFAEDLAPDIIADIRTLPCQDNSYHTVMACEVLEHIPWQDVPIALNELYRVSKHYVLISIPYSAIGLGIALWFPGIERVLNFSHLDAFLRFPLFFLRHQFDGEHYWEMGKAGYSYHKVKSLLKENFHILEEGRPTLQSYHYFFLLEKRFVE